MSVVILIAGILVWISQVIFTKLTSGKEEGNSGHLLLPCYFKYVGAGVLIIMAFLPLEFHVYKYQMDSVFRDLIIVFSLTLVAASSEKRKSSFLAGFRYFTLISSIASVALVTYFSTLIAGQAQTEPGGMRMLAALLFLYVGTFHLSKRKYISSMKIQ